VQWGSFSAASGSIDFCRQSPEMTDKDSDSFTLGNQRIDFLQIARRNIDRS
jgi:hypothetical protein